MAEVAVEVVLGLAGGDAFAGEAPVEVGEFGGFCGEDEGVEAVEGGGADGGFGLALEPTVGALGGDFRGEDEDVFVFGCEFGAGVVEDALDGWIFEEAGVAGTEAAGDFFPAFFVADD